MTKGDMYKLPKDFWKVGLFEVELMQTLLEMGFDKKLEKKCRK